MIIDARALGPTNTLRAPICVIGAGAAGTTLSLELAAAGHDVLLLEAGGRRVVRSAQDSLRAAQGGDAGHDRLELVRQKRLGGTTMQWGGRCVPFDQHDFAVRPHVTLSGWPIDRAELDAHYAKAHRYLRLGEYEYRASRVLDGPVALLGDEVGASEIVDDDRVWRWSPPVRFGETFFARLTTSPRVRVLLHANVVELVQSGQAVTAARVALGDGRTVEVVADRFVVATGGLECARLLLASNATTPAGLGNEGGMLGACYMTHPYSEIGKLAFTDPVRARAAAFMRDIEGVYCRRLLALRPEVQRREGLLNMACALWYPDPVDPSHADPLLSAFVLTRWAMTRTHLDWRSQGVQRRYGANPKLLRHLANVGRGAPSTLRFAAEWGRQRWFSDRAVPSFMVVPATGVMRLRFDAEQSPDPANRVELSRERDGFGMPRLQVHFRVSDGDRQSMIRSLELIAAEFRRTGTATLALDDRRELLGRDLVDGTHQMGVTRMAATPRTGVVDGDCRVHGVPNLFVASSSVFPTSGVASPTLTIVALAIRLAATVSASLRSPAGVGVGIT